MKKLVYFISITLLAIIITSKITKAQENTSNEGTEFYVAFPLNDTKQQMLQTLAIYVTSRVDNKVTIYNPYLGINATKLIKANETVEFSTVKGGFDYSIEIVKTNAIINAGIRVTSDFPVSVHCLNSKQVTAEGYMAIPTQSWGKEYIHNSFYDFAELKGIDWGGGFVVLAKDNNTEIRIQLRDGANRTKGFGKTTGGQQHGDSIIKILNAGEIYIVQGTGETRGTFDLSGSIITSDKPIGLISYHNRCMIPATVVNTGRDHLIEMLPPTQAWGKEYFSLELERNTDKGDYFRVVASEDNTTFNIEWYDNQTSQLIKSVSEIKLLRKGQWYEYNGEGAKIPHDIESIRGVAHFKADKPIMVCQYSYSADYDGSYEYDPFMILLPSVEQYSTSALSTTTLSYGSNKHIHSYLRVIAKGDPLDNSKNQQLLNSFKLNNTPINVLFSSFVYYRIPNSEYYWFTLLLNDPQTINLESETPFSATLYGMSYFDSYGWPASPNAIKLRDIDPETSVPFITQNNSLTLKLLSPNPSKSDRLKLNITNEESSVVRVNITNLDGKVMLELMNKMVIDSTEVEFDISELKSGIYFINATSHSSQSLIKLVIER